MCSGYQAVHFCGLGTRLAKEWLLVWSHQQVIGYEWYVVSLVLASATEKVKFTMANLSHRHSVIVDGYGFYHID